MPNVVLILTKTKKPPAGAEKQFANSHFEFCNNGFLVSEANGVFPRGVSCFAETVIALGMGAKARFQAHRHKARTKGVAKRHSQRGFLGFC